MAYFPETDIVKTPYDGRTIPHGIPTSGSLPGCRRFVQDAKLNVEALFQNALWHKEHKIEIFILARRNSQGWTFGGYGESDQE
jgi:hypothetical protein